MSLLVTEHLTRSFGGLVAVNDVSIEIGRSEIVGIIGPNGAGKSTFINLISGIRMPSSGRILFEGNDITGMPPHKRARIGIARTYQLIHPLESLNLIENVMVGFLFSRGRTKKEARLMAEALCEDLGLDEVERPIANLTILEIKKMEIAKALANGPKLLFLDEVMAGLNADETYDLIATIKRIAGEREIAVGVVEHVMGVIRELTQRVVVLDTGELIAYGPYAEVSQNPQVVRAYLGGGV